MSWSAEYSSWALLSFPAWMPRWKVLVPHHPLLLKTNRHYHLSDAVLLPRLVSMKSGCHFAAASQSSNHCPAMLELADCLE